MIAFVALCQPINIRPKLSDESSKRCNELMVYGGVFYELVLCVILNCMQRRRSFVVQPRVCVTHWHCARPQAPSRRGGM